MLTRSDMVKSAAIGPTTGSVRPLSNTVFNPAWVSSRPAAAFSPSSRQ